MTYFYVCTGGAESHFEKLKASGGVKQIWLVDKHTGEKFVQHNHADGTYQAYWLGNRDCVDQGRWSMENGSYSEQTGFPVSGTLHGDANNFYMDVDCGPHGYHKYTATNDTYDAGIKVEKATTTGGVSEERMAVLESKVDSLVEKLDQILELLKK